MKLDKVDRAIIDQLSQNARLSNVALADSVHLTPGPCLRRVQRLEDEGVILGYEAVTDPKALGRGFEAIVDIDLALFDRETVTRFEETLVGFTEVVELHRLFGSPDYFMRVAVADLEAYEQFLVNRVQAIPGVARVTSRFTMKVLKSARRR